MCTVGMLSAWRFNVGMLGAPLLAVGMLSAWRYAVGMLNAPLLAVGMSGVSRFNVCPIPLFAVGIKDPTPNLLLWA